MRIVHIGRNIITDIATAIKRIGNILFQFWLIYIFVMGEILFDELIANGDVDIIDVREADEIPIIKEFIHHKIPLLQLQDNLSLIKSGTIITFCQSGARSLQAAKELMTIFGTSKKIYSLRGGIMQWKLQHSKQAV